MIPLAVPNLSGNEGRYLQECIASSFVSSVGPYVCEFENRVAAAAGSRSGVAVSSGTAGLHTALLAVGVGPGDLVVVPSLTFIATANAVSYCGALPWLLDVGPADWNLDPQLLADAFAKDVRPGPDGPVHKPTGRRVAALLPVHTLGLPADMDAIVAVARTYGLPVIADAACALGASDRGRPAGALGADLSVFSFNGNKTITAGGGGVVVGDHPDLIDLCRHLSTTARMGEHYDHDRVGFNYRMTNLQAAVGCAQMEQLDQFVQAKRSIRARYDAALADLPGVGLFPGRDGTLSGCWFSGILLSEAQAEEAGRLRQALRARGIDAKPFWKCLHLQRPYLASPQRLTGMADGIWRRILTLPCSTHLTDQEQAHVIETVREEVLRL